MQKDLILINTTEEKSWGVPVGGRAGGESPRAAEGGGCLFLPFGQIVFLNVPLPLKKVFLLLVCLSISRT